MLIIPDVHHLQDEELSLDLSDFVERQYVDGLPGELHGELLQARSHKLHHFIQIISLLDVE